MRNFLIVTGMVTLALACWTYFLFWIQYIPSEDDVRTAYGVWIEAQRDDEIRERKYRKH